MSQESPGRSHVATGYVTQECRLNGRAPSCVDGPRVHRGTTAGHMSFEAEHQASNKPLTCNLSRGAGRTRTCDRRIMSLIQPSSPTCGADQFAIVDGLTRAPHSLALRLRPGSRSLATNSG